jgi:hypothetical protein
MGFAHMRHPRSWLAAATTISTLLGACGSTSTAAAPTLPTVMVVKPETFLGSLACLDTPGGAQMYVATLEDRTPNLYGQAGSTATSFILPSSEPTSCHRASGFGFVVPGHQYAADIQVYDRQVWSAAPGSSQMLDAPSPNGAFVAPRWTTNCGRDPLTTGFGPSICVQNFMVTMRGCIPLVNSAPSAQTIVALRPKTALGDLDCGTSAGQIGSFVVVPEDPNLEQKTAASCDAEFTYSGLLPGKRHGFDLFAYEPGGAAPRWGTTCTADPIAGATVVATCDPLSDHGTLVVDLGAWLASAHQACSADGVTEITVSVFTPNGVIAESATLPDCALPLTFPALVPGSYPIQVSASTAAGPGPAGRCDAVVMPGTITVATCDPVGA